MMEVPPTIGWREFAQTVRIRCWGSSEVRARLRRELAFASLPEAFSAELAEPILDPKWILFGREELSGAVLLAWSLESGGSLPRTVRDLHANARFLSFEFRPESREVLIRDRRFTPSESWARYRITLSEGGSGQTVTVIAGPMRDRDAVPADLAEHDPSEMLMISR
jgi:hypothetical protein